MVKICPISERNINENVSRLNASFTLIIGVLFIITGSFWFLFAMLTDFIFRLLSEGKLSPLIKLNTYLLENFNARKVIINAGPKIFAARIGLLLTAISLLFWFLNLPFASFITAGILVFFSFLESVFGFCVACKIYPYALVLNDIRLYRRNTIK
jgi:hypothetical protein